MTHMDDDQIMLFGDEIAPLTLYETLPQLETKPAAFEVLDHVNGTYVTTNEQAALATEFPYNGLYRRVGVMV